MPLKSDKIYVVVVTYNGSKWISQCLDSIKNSDLPLIAVVVDNFSDDDTLEIINKNFSDTIILSLEKNLGFGRANNIGISRALKDGADYIFLLNQDAFLLHDTIDGLVKIAKSNPEYGIISPIHYNGDKTAVEKHFLKVIDPRAVKYLISDLITRNYRKNIYSVPFVPAAAWLIPKNTFEKVGGFDPIFFMYGEDDNYCQRVLFHGFKIGVVPISGILHDTMDNNKPAANFSRKYYNQFINSTKTLYADVNTDKVLKINSFRAYLLRKAIQQLFQGKITRFRSYISKFKMINPEEILNSYNNNRLEQPNYLDINLKSNQEKYAE